MGLFDGLLGNASDVDVEEVAESLAPVLIEGESVVLAYQVIRDQYVFTNHRLIMVDVQGVTGKKKEYLTIPYKSVTNFAVETAGSFDADAELKLWVSGRSEPIVREFSGGSAILDVQKALASGMFGKL